MTRISTRNSGITCRADFEKKVDEAAELDVELRQLNAEMDEKLQAVRSQYTDRIQAKSNYRQSLLGACASYAAMHREEVLKPGLRSGETALARFGFKLGNPTLVLLSSKHKWKTVIAAIRAKGEEWVEKYLTQPDPKPNKDAMKANLTDAQLAELGTRIEQTDAFFIEAKDNNEPEA